MLCIYKAKNHLGLTKLNLLHLLTFSFLIWLHIIFLLWYEKKANISNISKFIFDSFWFLKQINFYTSIKFYFQTTLSGQVTLTHAGALKGKANETSGSLVTVGDGDTQELTCFLSREVISFMGIHTLDVVDSQSLPAPRLLTLAVLPCWNQLY